MAYSGHWQLHAETPSLHGFLLLMWLAWQLHLAETRSNLNALPRSPMTVVALQRGSVLCESGQS
eukprot:5942071-Amphidinium_carterae.3